MRHQARRGPAAILIITAAALVLGSLPVIATAPQPVIRREGPSELPVFDPIEQEELCRGGRDRPATGDLGRAATIGREAAVVFGPGATTGLPSTAIGLHRARIPFDARERLTYPRPLVPVPGGADGDDEPAGEEGEEGDEDGSEGPPAPTCSTQLSLGLVIVSPDGRRPEGTNAFLDDRVVRQPVLESGFQAALQAQDHRVTLPDPRGDWKLVGTSCGCLGPTPAATPAGMRSLSDATRPDRLLAYPGPVVQVGGSCTSRPGSSPAPGADLRFTASPIGHRERTTYPGPAIKLPGADPTDEVEEPPPPRPATLAWNDLGTVTITDPDGVGGAFDCVWTVEEQLLIPREGPWRASNRRGRLDCGPLFRQPISPGPTERGRISVRDEGRRLVMAGSRGGSLDFVVDRDPERPRRYLGTTRLSLPGSGRFDFRVTLDLVTAERMDGLLTATARVQGRRCDVRRAFVLTYAGRD